jgi:hypothetical protein
LGDSDRQRELHAKVWPYQDLWWVLPFRFRLFALGISNFLDESHTSFGRRRRLVPLAPYKTARNINLPFYTYPNERGIMVSGDQWRRCVRRPPKQLAHRDPRVGEHPQWIRKRSFLQIEADLVPPQLLRAESLVHFLPMMSQNHPRKALMQRLWPRGT